MADWKRDVTGGTVYCSGSCLRVTQFVYDGNGNRVLTIWPDSTTTAFIGEHYEAEGDVTRSYYWLGGQPIAMRVDDGETSEVTWFPAGCGTLRSHTDHPSAALRTGLGSTSLLSTISGTLVMSSTTRFLPFGEYRVEPNHDLTDKGFTGHAHNSYIKLVDMKARWYSPYLNRWIQPDTIIPDPRNPQSLNRYSYVYNNPVKYTDPGGHIAWLAIGVVVLKAIDWGWTAWDTYQSGRVLADPNASGADKMMAGLNVALAGLFEVIEPDDLLPIGLPADDVARRAVMEGAQQAFEAGGVEALERFARVSLGEHADEVLGYVWDAACTGQRHHVFSAKIMRSLSEHEVLRGIFGRDDIILRAFDEASHAGYQTWHRAYDEMVVTWLMENPYAGREELLSFLIDVYSSGDMRNRFPSAVATLIEILDNQ